MSDTALSEVTKNIPGIPDEHVLIYRLEAELLKYPQVEMPLEHAFCNGVYARTIHIPINTVLTGAVHRHESFFLLRRGIMVVSTGEDEQRQMFPGDMSITKPGMKRAIITITDVEITTFHANPDNETDPEALWNMFTIPACQAAIELGAKS